MVCQWVMMLWLVNISEQDKLKKLPPNVGVFLILVASEEYSQEITIHV